MDIGGDPEWTKRFFTRIIDRNMVMLENVLDCTEIDGVLLGSDWGSQKGLLMSPESWDDLIPRLVEMEIDVLNPVQPECMDIDVLKRDFGDRLAF